MSDQKTRTPQVVIIGGGFAGLNAARALAGAPAQVTLVDKTNHHLFQPLLYQVATAALSPADVSEPIRAVLTRQANCQVVLGEVRAIDPEARCITLRNGRSCPFDYLLVAVGAVYHYFGHADWARYAPGLKTLEDALQIRERILLSLEEADQLPEPALRRPYLTYVVIGGGPTGVEMAGAIAEITKHRMMCEYPNFDRSETRIYLLEAAPRLLQGFAEHLAVQAQRDLERMGVTVLLNTPVTDIDAHMVHIGDSSLGTPNVFWAAGVAAHPLLNMLPGDCDRGGRMRVNPDLSLPEAPHIFVLGDAAHCPDQNGVPLPALAPVAMQQGRFVGKLLRQRLKNPDAAATNTPAFRYVDRGKMATIGRAKAVAEIRSHRCHGFIAWLLWSFVHIFYLIGFRNRIRVFLEWVWFYFTFKRGVRLITDRALRDWEQPRDPNVPEDARENARGAGAKYRG